MFLYLSIAVFHFAYPRLFVQVSQVQNIPGDRPPLPRFISGPGVVRPTPLGGLPFNAPTEQDILEGNRGGSRMGAARLPMIPPQLMQVTYFNCLDCQLRTYLRIVPIF